MTGIGLIVYALVIVSKVPDTADQTIAVYQTREQCVYETQRILMQGPSAYCVPVNQLSEKDANEQVKNLTRITGTSFMRETHDISSN